MSHDPKEKPVAHDGPLPLVMNRETADAYYWGDGRCQAWRLLEGQDLTVVEEIMPPGTSEHRHSHTFSRQFFYVLEGEAEMDVAERTHSLSVGDGVMVAPKQAHCIRNVSAADVRFLVISAPRAAGDRTPR